MQIMMLPFDSFESVRIGVYDGSHKEPIAPPLEKGDPKKGWYILAIDAAQCTILADPEEDEGKDEAVADSEERLDKMQQLLDSMKDLPADSREIMQAEIDAHRTSLQYSTAQPISDVDRALFILWGLPKRGAVAGQAPTPEGKPKEEIETETETEDTPEPK